MKKAMANPKRIIGWLLALCKDSLLWENFYKALREPKVRSFIPRGPKIFQNIIDGLEKQGFTIKDFVIDTQEFEKFLRVVDYPTKYPQYSHIRNNFLEKALEHFVCAKLLELNMSDVFIDIASSDSPVWDIYRRLYGCDTYRQDMVFKGFKGNTIGGDATNMPLPSGFATKMALHCSFEHFEGDADMRFLKEADRVLRPGGRMCILPLYLFSAYAIQTDPSVLPKGGLSYEKDAILFAAKGYKNRHGRFYDPLHLKSRIKNNLGDFRLTILVVKNEMEIDSACYLKFICLLDK